MPQSPGLRRVSQKGRSIVSEILLEKERLTEMKNKILNLNEKVDLSPETA